MKNVETGLFFLIFLEELTNVKECLIVFPYNISISHSLSHL